MVYFVFKSRKILPPIESKVDNLNKSISFVYFSFYLNLKQTGNLRPLLEGVLRRKKGI